jgi:gas vesicle protein
MAERSDQIRSEIEDTRERVGETVDALAYKADVPTRAKDWLGEKKDAVTSMVSGSTPDGENVKRRMHGLRRTAERNPVGLAIGGAALGFVAGLLVPSTRIEDERIGPMSDELKSTAADAGREAVERGKDVMQEAGQAAVETAEKRGRQASQELSASLQEKAGEVAGTASHPEQSPPTGGRAV